MKINWKRLTGFVLLFFVLAFFFWFHQRRFYLLLLFAMVVAFISSFTILRKSFLLPEFVLKAGQEVITLGDTVRVRSLIQCSGYYPFSKITARYGIMNTQEGKKHYLQDSYSAFHGQNEYGFDINLSFCGIYRVTCEEIWVYDCFGLFAKKPAELPSADILVLPERINEQFPMEKETLFSKEDIYSDPNAGQDVSEIKELREYREGDVLSKVHWKLSTKSEDLIVKEYARLAGVCLAVACSGDFTDLRSMTEYYEMLYALGLQFLEEEQYFELLYMSRTEGNLATVRIDNPYDFKNCIQDMYYHLESVSAEEIKEAYEAENRKARLLFLSVASMDSNYGQLAEYHNIGLYELLD